MADPELWHAIHRLAVIVKHMDVDGELGVEMDGILDKITGYVTGKVRKLKDWALDNAEIPKDDYAIENIGTYSQYTKALENYESDLKGVTESVKTNNIELKRVGKLASDTSKANIKRDVAKTEEGRLKQLQSTYENKEKILKDVVHLHKDIVLRFKESYNEMEDYKSRLNAAVAANTQLQADLTRLKGEEELLAKVPAKTDV